MMPGSAIQKRWVVSVAIAAAVALLTTLSTETWGGHASAGTTTTGPSIQIAKLTSGDAATNDEFGYSVAISGDTAVVGAPYDDDAGSDSGSAYVFVRSGASWSQQAKLTAGDAAAGDEFGYSVAISGDTAMVGAYADDDGGSESGSAYVFVRSGASWSQQAKLTAGDAAADDWFGFSVAISGDTAVAGANGDDDAGAYSGSAYVFVRSGASWSQQTKLTAGDAAADNEFGYSVAISGDTAVVGAHLDDDGGSDSGSAYAFGSVPGTPTNVTATGGNAQATVSWDAPISDGGSPITQYTVTASPGGATANTAGTSVTVTGLTNGTAYTFTVTATNSVGTGPASAASNAVTPTAPVATPGQVLTDLLALTLLNLQTGQAVGISVLPVDDNGNINLGMPDVTYHWSAGSCGTVDDYTSRTPTFTAIGSACSGTIGVHAYQDSGPQVPASDRLIAVSVASPPATPAPTAVPTDPTVIPEIIPEGLAPGDISVILPSSGGTFAVTQTLGLPPISIEVPSGALDSGTVAAVTINVVSVGDVTGPPPPATEGASSGTFRFGSTIIEVQWFDDSGAALDTFSLNRPAVICVPYNQADIGAAAGGPDGMAVWRFNGTEWIQLNSTVNTWDGTVCARTLDFSFFALGLAVPAPDAEGATLPATGDYAPNAVTLMLALLAGVGLVATGAFTLRRARRVRGTS